MKGFSKSNLKYARRLAEAWSSEDRIRQQPVGQLPWSHTIQLLDKLDDQRLRDWYAAQDAHHGWSRAVLQHQIAARLHERAGAAPSNFGSALKRADSELAQQLTKIRMPSTSLRSTRTRASANLRSGSRFVS
ncbi:MULTISPECIES: DUF1016 N-terminal domain-containing protein [unclassified Pseudoclavibacter]|uniref:DUF1016 N-terminal domain-containing protein n=1 Tax=unclassified Pseudoclavibacter TaxID=2615177 RepID=UPI002015F2E3|nr:DUF1016 N-terminal domain-containing protein [Pseudoclavibacter sp. Marseille-Q4354]